MTNLILWGTQLFILGISMWQVLNEAKPKKNLILGVTLPFEAREDPQVLAVLAQHKKSQKLSFLILALICIACCFIPNFSVSMILWSFIFIVCLTIPALWMVRANRQLKELKSQNGWTNNQGSVICVDSSSLSLGKKATVWGYLPAIFICILFALFDSAFWYIHLVSAFFALFSFFAARYLYRNKSETVDNDPARTKALSELRRKRWNRLWLLVAYCLASISLCMMFASRTPSLSMFLTIFFTVAFTAACFFLERGTRRLQEKLTADSGKGWYVDDDDHWLGGLVYYNPNDSHILINQRTGTGTTINLATKTGKFLSTISILCILIAPIVVISISGLETQPITLTLTDQAVQCKAGFEEYTIPLDEIESAELLETLPRSLFRIWGTGMPHYLGGNFQAEGFSSIYLALDPEVSPFLLIQTTSGKNYLFGMRDAADLRQFYSELSSQVSVA